MQNKSFDTALKIVRIEKNFLGYHSRNDCTTPTGIFFCGGLDIIVKIITFITVMHTC